MNEQTEKLEKFLENRWEERAKEKEREFDLYENLEEVKNGLESRLTDFYCTHCEEDYEDYRTTGVVETDWSKPGKFIAYWNSKHSCGRWNRRLATNKHEDPYWFRSKKMALDKGNYYKDMIQPHESGFDMLYSYKFNQKQE